MDNRKIEEWIKEHEDSKTKLELAQEKIMEMLDTEEDFEEIIFGEPRHINEHDVSLKKEIDEMTYLIMSDWGISHDPHSFLYVYKEE